MYGNQKEKAHRKNTYLCHKVTRIFRYDFSFWICGQLYKINSFNEFFNKWQGCSDGYRVRTAFPRDDVRSVIIKCRSFCYTGADPFDIFFCKIWCYMTAEDYRVFQYHMKIVDKDG